jgi:flagellar biosynthesis/type III secretory pathway protein FliH
MHQHFFAAKDAELQIAGKLRKEYKSGHQKGQAEGRKQGCKEGREEVKRSREYQLGKAILRPVRKLGQWFGKKRGE